MKIRLLCFTTLIACGSEVAPPSKSGRPPELVRAQGTRLIDGHGALFHLRGVALGASFFHETWISSFDYPPASRFVREAELLSVRAAAIEALREVGSADEWAPLERALATRTSSAVARAVIAAAEAAPEVWDDADRPLFDALDARFGEPKRREISAAFRAAWIGERDLDYIAELGLNVVRIPMGWRQLVEGPLRSPLTLDPAAMAQLDALLDGCARRGLYAIVDLQESPGGHNDYSGRGTLYEDPAMQALTVELWTTLAARWRERTEIAAYSLLAEPMSAPSTEAMMEMYDRLHDAVRATGDQHLLVIHDGFRGLLELPTPQAMGWTNVTYSTHYFDNSDAIERFDFLRALYEGTLAQAEVLHQVPMFVGSFSTMGGAEANYLALERYLSLFEQRRWSWSLWTYKRIDDPIEREVFGAETSWGVLRDAGPGWRRVDLSRDSAADVLAKVATVDSTHVAPNTRVETLIKNAIAP